MCKAGRAINTLQTSHSEWTGKVQGVQVFTIATCCHEHVKRCCLIASFLQLSQTAIRHIPRHAGAITLACCLRHVHAAQYISVALLTPAPPYLQLHMRGIAQQVILSLYHANPAQPPISSSMGNRLNCELPGQHMAQFPQECYQSAVAARAEWQSNAKAYQLRSSDSQVPMHGKPGKGLKLAVQ